MLMFYKWAFMCSFILNLILCLTSLPLSPSLPFSSNSLSPFQFSTYFYLLTSFSRPLHVSLLFYIPWSLAFSHFLSPSPVISMISFIFTMLCFHFLSLPFFFASPPLCSNTPLLRQSLCVRGLCCECRRPALCRRQSTRQGRGARTRCSLETVCTSCPGPPIAPTCCMSMPPGKTSNRTEPPPPTSEGASHCPGWSNSICCYIDLLAFDVDMVGDSRMVPLWCQLAHSQAIL